MEKELTIKHLSPYLPYNLELIYNDCLNSRKIKAILTGISKSGIETTYKRKTNGCVGDLMEWVGHNNISEMQVKLLLRPLSDLTKEIEVNGERFVPIEWLEDKYYTLDLHKQCKRIVEEPMWVNQCDYMLIMHLIEWHFDVFQLIEKGLAIDLNTIQK